jgi:hypothetical protein
MGACECSSERASEQIPSQIFDVEVWYKQYGFVDSFTFKKGIRPSIYEDTQAKFKANYVSILANWPNEGHSVAKL